MTFWQDKTVLVAGGAGFIGHHLVKTLLQANASIHVIDDFSTGQKTRLETLQADHKDQLTIKAHDIATSTNLPTVDIIYNLASRASPIHYQADPIGTWKSNVLGTLHLLEHSLASGAILVQASTSEIYGDPLSHPQKETDWGNVNPIGPRACYDESKRAAETLLMDAVRVKNADVRVGRIFNTYGPGMNVHDGRAIPNFFAQAQAGNALTIHGDGQQTRSFCHVNDTVTGLMQLGSVNAAKGEIINIGNPVEVTVLEIANRVNALFENSAQIAFHPRPVDDPSRRCPDISKAKRILNWKPTVSLDVGLKTVAEIPVPAQ